MVGENVLNTDPKFNFEKGDTTDYYLLANSPMIDAGIDLSTLNILLTTDINGFIRPNKNGYDIGPFEYYKTDPVSIRYKLNEEKEVQVYPNPTTGIVNIQTKNNNEKVSINVYTLTGRNVYCNPAFTGSIINLSGLNKGLYLVNIISGSNNTVIKLIKK
jgi:hypothetical protein